MRFISSNVESTGACAPSADLATPMSMMPGTSVNAPRGGEGVTRKVDGKRAPEVKVVLAFRVCEVEGECPSLGRVQRRQALGQLLSHKRLHVRLPSRPRRTPRIFAPRANPRPGAAAGSLSREQSARSCRTHLKKVRKTFNRTTSVEQSGVHTTTEDPRNGGGEMVGDGFKALSGPTLR